MSSRDVTFDESVVFNSPALVNPNEDEFEVEAITDKREINGNTEYLIKWKDFDESENTWEPFSHVADLEALDNFERRISNRHALIACSTLDEPANYYEVMRSPEKDHWIHAIDDEMQSLGKCDTWTIVELPDGRRSIGSKWVFKKKFDVNRNIE